MFFCAKQPLQIALSVRPMSLGPIWPKVSGRTPLPLLRALVFRRKCGNNNSLFVFLLCGGNYEAEPDYIALSCCKICTCVCIMCLYIQVDSYKGTFFMEDYDLSVQSILNMYIWTVENKVRKRKILNAMKWSVAMRFSSAL